MTNHRPERHTKLPVEDWKSSSFCAGQNRVVAPVFCYVLFGPTEMDTPASVRESSRAEEYKLDYRLHSDQIGRLEMESAQPAVGQC